jgi:hypothetical protein
MADNWDQFPAAAAPAGQWDQFPVAQAEANQPPEGVIIHDADRSYVVGPTGSPEVNTKGMDNDQRSLAAAGLAERRDSGDGLASMRPLTPPFQGLTMGYGDEAVSAAKGLRGMLSGKPFGDTYNLAQEAQRQELAQEREEHPKRSIASQILGSLGLAPALAPLAAAGAAAPGAAVPLAGRMAIGAGVGAGTGAVEGFGSGSGLEDRLKQGGVGAALGGVVGAAVPPVVQGASSVARNLLDYFGITRALNRSGMSREAGDVLRRTIDPDEATTGAGAARIASGGPNAMLADANLATGGALDTAIARTGPGANRAQQAVNDRLHDETQNLRGTLDRTLGAPQGEQTVIGDIRDSTRAARGTAYDAAYNTPINYASPEGQALLGELDRIPGKAFAKANELMQLGGHRSQQILVDVADDGTVTLRQAPDVRQLDYITRALRTLAVSGEDAGQLGARTDFSGAYTNLAGDIRRQMRQLVPEYGAALDTAADPISRVAAVKYGSNMLSRGVTRDEVAQEVDGMSTPELTAIRQGVREQIDEAMANARWVASRPDQEVSQGLEALRKLNTQAARTKMTTILGPNEAMELSGALERATRAAELHAQTMTNSRTFGRTAMAEAARQSSEPGLVGSLLEGKPLQAGQRSMQFVFGRTPQDKLAREDDLHRQVAEALTVPRGQDALNSLDALVQAYRREPQNAELARLMGGGIGAGAGLAGFEGGRAALLGPYGGRR